MLCDRTISYRYGYLVLSSHDKIGDTPTDAWCFTRKGQPPKTLWLCFLFRNKGPSYENNNYIQKSFHSENPGHGIGVALGRAQ
jgi:hypothetical protein